MTGTHPRLCLMGVSYSTGNLGVSALAEGAIRGILDCAPGAAITMLGEGGGASEVRVEHDGSFVRVAVIPIGYGKRVWRTNHLVYAYPMALAARCLPRGRIRSAVLRANPILRVLDEADVVADVSGGDSFTDIYGPKRVALQGLRKSLVFLTGKSLVLLPQTIGPFTGRFGRAVARFVLRRAKKVYTRDIEGLDEARALAGETLDGRLCFAPDLGLIVESREPGDANLVSRLSTLAKRNTLVGMNVSGLLYNGGYTRGNQFDLKSDYKALCVGLVKELLKDDNAFVLFVPHVITSGKWKMEDDSDACEKVREALLPEERERTMVLGGGLGVRETKYVIGRCAFFVGSRMHACIAALSQGIPAVGIAYSRKFRGVFETLGVEAQVADPRTMPQEEIRELVMTAFSRRAGMAMTLSRSVPAAKEQVRAVFEDLLRIGAKGLA